MGIGAMMIPRPAFAALEEPVADLAPKLPPEKWSECVVDPALATEHSPTWRRCSVVVGYVTDASGRRFALRACRFCGAEVLDEEPEEAIEERAA